MRELRQAKPGRGGRRRTETFQWSPAGQACPAKVGHQPVPSVAWTRATSATKRTQGVCRPRQFNPEIGLVVRANIDSLMEGSTGAPAETWQGAKVSPGALSGACTRGFPRNLGGLAISMRSTGTGSRVKMSRSHVAALGDGGSEQRAHAWNRQAKETKRGGMDGETSELFVVPTKQGNREGPCGGKGEPEDGIVGGKDGRELEPWNCLNETAADSGAGEATTADGAQPQSPHRRRVSPRGLPTDPQGWGGGRGRADGDGLRGEPGGESPVAAGSLRVGHVPRATGPAGAHPEGRQRQDAADRDPDLRGQGPAEGGEHGDERGVRAGLPALLVRFSAGSLGAPRLGGSLARPDDDGWGLGARGGYPGVLRHPWTTAICGSFSAGGFGTA